MKKCKKRHFSFFTLSQNSSVCCGDRELQQKCIITAVILPCHFGGCIPTLIPHLLPAGCSNCSRKTCPFGGLTVRDERASDPSASRRRAPVRAYLLGAPQEVTKSTPRSSTETTRTLQDRSGVARSGSASLLSASLATRLNPRRLTFVTSTDNSEDYSLQQIHTDLAHPDCRHPSGCGSQRHRPRNSGTSPKAGRVRQRVHVTRRRSGDDTQRRCSEHSPADTAMAERAPRKAAASWPSRASGTARNRPMGGLPMAS